MIRVQTKGESVKPAQLAFAFMVEPPKKAPPAPTTCPLSDKIVAAKLEANAFLLKLNSGLTNPDDVPLPSRLFHFPIEYVEAHGKQPAKLVLRHPDLPGYLPYIATVEAAIGVKIGWEPTDRFGRPMDMGEWWHAVDLCTDKHFRGLLETRHFTTPRCIFRSIGLNMHGGSLSAENARIILAELGSVEPDDRSEGELLGEHLSPFTRTTDDRGKTIKSPTHAINYHNLKGPADAESWFYVHGVEDGWLVRGRGKQGYLGVSNDGMRRRAEVRQGVPA